MTGSVAILGAALSLGFADRSHPEPEQPGSAYVLDREMNLIDGTPIRLDEYEGKVILIVNTASRCGLTPQYETLEKLYREHKDEGFVILGFPANNFGKQEPGSNDEIAEFCRERYEVSFPMFEKISVRGEDCHPLYAQLAKQPEPIGGEPEWNFAKFLINREGRVVHRFASKTKPTDKEFLGVVRLLLDEESPSP